MAGDEMDTSHIQALRGRVTAFSCLKAIQDVKKTNGSINILEAVEESEDD